MYEELVERLKIAADWAGKGFRITPSLCLEAADAIEKLIAFNAMWQGAAEFAKENKPKWIPVTERLPDNQRPVLVCVPPYTVGEEEYIGYVGMAYFTCSPNGGFWCGTDGNIYGAIGFIHKPFAWMPLPEPPKEE